MYTHTLHLQRRWVQLTLFHRHPPTTRQHYLHLHCHRSHIIPCLPTLQAQITIIMHHHHHNPCQLQITNFHLHRLPRQLIWQHGISKSTNHKSLKEKALTLHIRTTIRNITSSMNPLLQARHHPHHPQKNVDIANNRMNYSANHRKKPTILHLNKKEDKTLELDLISSLILYHLWIMEIEARHWYYKNVRLW